MSNVNKKFKFHSDAGHGWLAVKISLIKQLGLTYEISPYSYVKGQTAYLEEDSDRSKFVIAYRAKYGCEPEIDELPSKDRSPIRSFERFEPFNVVDQTYNSY
jgi:hypothetical protein